MKDYLAEHPEPFDPETIQVLSDALDDAWQRVQSSGVYLDGQADMARAVLAKNIIDRASRGERDPKNPRQQHGNRTVKSFHEFGRKKSQIVI